MLEPSRVAEGRQVYERMQLGTARVVRYAIMDSNQHWLAPQVYWSDCSPKLFGIDLISDSDLIRNEIYSWKNLSSDEKQSVLPIQLWQKDGYTPMANACGIKILVGDKIIRMYTADEVETMPSSQSIESEAE